MTAASLDIPCWNCIAGIIFGVPSYSLLWWGRSSLGRNG